MKFSKNIFFTSIIIIVVLVTIIAKFAYSIGQHTASLTVKEANPMQLAEAMQSDNFYGNYSQTMLLVNGPVQGVTQQGNTTIVQFEVTKSPTALGKVSCEFEGNRTIKTGETIHVLAVAYDAQRQETSDVFMPKCYLLSKGNL